MRRRSTGRCQIPWRPGRFPAAGASKRIAPGAGASSAAVLDEYSTARGRCSSRPATAARRAERAQASSISANVRHSRTRAARTTATFAPGALERTGQLRVGLAQAGRAAERDEQDVGAASNAVHAEELAAEARARGSAGSG